MIGLDQFLSDWVASYGMLAEEGLRLLIAAVAGGLVGLERELRGRQAGFRTNLLVCLGSALVMIISTHLADRPWVRGEGFQITVDPGRIAYGVMTGVGFLGAGAILKNRGDVRGLTTAAALWCVAAIGLGAGLGLYALSIVSALLVLVSLWGLDALEHLLPKRSTRVITIRARWSAGCVHELVTFIQAQKVTVFGVTFRRPDAEHVDISADIAFTRSRRYYDLERKFQEDPRYDLVALERS